MTDAAELVKLADELPTRLRGFVEDGQSVPLSDALEQAADEIERLRAALAAQQDGARTDFENAPRICLGWCVSGAGETNAEWRVVWRAKSWNGVESWVADGAVQNVKFWSPLPAPPPL